ncbi:MAG: hypothetical protein AAF982_08765 [Pseudomonadota bacterium]
MGYTVMNYGAKTDIDAARYVLKNEIEFEDGPDRNRVLAFANVIDPDGLGYGFFTHAAVEVVRGKERAVTAFVVKQHRTGFEIGWTITPETMGPYETRCPAALLDMLTAPENPCARNFRAKARARAEAGGHQAPIFTMNGRG